VGERGTWSKGARACGGGRRTCGHGRVHDGGHGRQVRDGLTGGVREAERESAFKKEKTQTGQPHRAVRGRERARESAPTGGVRLSGTEGARARVRDWAWWADWAELGFPFSWEFLIAFLFIFSRVFNSNQVLNSNQIKHVQQFKEYLEINMMLHFMTHIVLTK
jgi:hypothetical protein